MSRINQFTSVKELRDRFFKKKTDVVYDSKTYRWKDSVLNAVMKMKYWDGWDTFNETWDVLWVGWDPTHQLWMAGRHHSPFRKIVEPIRLVRRDLRTMMMMETYLVEMQY